MGWRALITMLALSSACCSQHAERQTRESTRVELAIEAALERRLGVPPRVRCEWLPPGCRAQLADGSELVVWVGSSRGEIVWKLDGMLALADDIEAYVREVVVETMGAPQAVRCGARVRVLHEGDRIECGLEHGGRAFAVVRAGGTLAFEIVLDPAVGQARSEVVTIERSAELDRMSKKLGGDVDGEREDE